MRHLSATRICALAFLLIALLFTGTQCSGNSPPLSSQESSTTTPSSFSPSSQSTFLYDQISEESISSGDYNVSENDKYKGKWQVSEATSLKVDNRKMLLIPQKALHYGIIRKFPEALVVQDKDLVVQYEVKYDAPLSCAGSYVKLLHNDAVKAMKDSNEFDDSTPYVIMFGPDKCGMNDKVHFIVRHQNPISKEWQEHHLRNPPATENDQLTHVYSLIVRKDNSFEILIDGESRKKGSLLEDMDPPINPPKMIDDPQDKKPDDWVDEEYIDDLDAVKPDDWDESQPEEIPDPNDSMPQGWLVDEPAQIPDPEAEAPEDWDEEEDGVWQAPLVVNPECEEVGCGEWTPRFIKNPAFKGKWHAPKIKNPAYKGVWTPRLIDNPQYFEDAHPHNLPPIGALSMDLWTMDDNIGFGSFLISFDEKDARDFIEHVWSARHDAEKALVPSTNKNAKPVTETVKDWVMEKLGELPMGILVLAAIFTALIPIVSCCGIWRAIRPAPKRKTEKKDDEEHAEEEPEDLLQDEDEEVALKTDEKSENANAQEDTPTTTRKRRKAKKIH
eukprot:CAMPEP_0117439348 /NCGR_PEP_ID=MMETSP0759-20121206/2519_1 /TAXON_ID=63605 /ORGANISM="Percolomonas cosmopolitus, Strain WS" /LENGTH=556 /DNA_ID=CAMNT_0005231061 /DNA_START=35 /DNA_END=1705 /DNA_ORIENTATION=-